MPTPSRSRMAPRVIAYVEANYAAQITLRDVADALGYSASYLTDSFRRQTGTPVTAWIIQRRIRAARELFAQGGRSVADVSQAVGFNDLCYFGRQFCRHTGTTPGRFRASAQRVRVR
jgi:AraC-like DNA-binding protein